MAARHDREIVLLEKLRGLSDQRVTEVEDFIDFLHARDEHKLLLDVAARLTEASLTAVWDNAEDDVYNDL